MYNNLTFISNPTNGILLLINLTLWTFSVGSYGKKRLVMLRPCRGIPALQPSLIKGLKISAPENEQPEYVGASPCIKKDKNFKKRSRFVGLCKKSAIFAVIITIVD